MAAFSAQSVWNLNTREHQFPFTRGGSDLLAPISAFKENSWGSVSLSSTSSASLLAATVAGFGLSTAFRRKRPRHRGSTQSTTVAAERVQDRIADFYDASTGIWVELWGEHLHHGFYPEGFKGTFEQHKQAQVEMIEQVLKWAEIPEAGNPDAPKSMLDVGCGIGGSSRHLNRKYNCTTTGITLSHKQRNQAEQFSKASGQHNSCSFKVADALNMPFEDNSFDLVWSLESGEHMPNKPAFMSELRRVCKPGGRIILVTWVHRDLLDGEVMKPSEVRLLNRISKSFHVPNWCSLADYVDIAEQDLGLEEIRIADWTNHIKPFWGAVIRTALEPRGWWALIRGGWQMIRGALVMPLMARGYNTGTIRFGLLTGTKPPSTSTSSQAESALKEKVQLSTSSRALPVVKMDHRPIPGNCRTQSTLAGTATGANWQAQVPSKGRQFRSRLARRGAATMQQVGGASFSQTASTIWDFTRPHTFIGTLLSVPCVQLFAFGPMFMSKGAAVTVPVVAWSIMLALVPALLINVYITGLNQIFDIAIDRVNKPYLPIPSGRLNRAGAIGICAIALALAFGWTCAFLQSRSWPLLLTLAGSTFLGTIYSAPPVRLKKYPFLAAFCIIVVRGLLVNLGFFCFAMEGFGKLGFESLETRSFVAAGFFCIFGLVIALMKDVPDILGDRMNGVRTLSVRLGPELVLSITTTALWFLFATTAGMFCYRAASAYFAGQSVLAACRVVLSCACMGSLRFLMVRWSKVHARDPEQVYDFYMAVWRIFFAAYALLPFAQ